MEIELSAGTIDYQDTGGDGPAVVLLHGLLMDGSLWRHVVAELRADHRCVVPTLPLGGHRRPMRPGADLSGRGQARLVAELLERLALSDVTLVGSDWGGAQLVVSEGCDERVGRLVLCAQEAFDNYPPGLPGRAIGLAARVPGGLGAALAPLVLRPLRRTPLTFGWMSRRPVPDEIMDAWLRPALGQAAIRRDLRRYICTSDLNDYVRAAEDLRSFTRPALVVWGTQDRVMPVEHGRRLAALLSAGRLVEIDDSYTLISEDQPAELAVTIRRFTREAVEPAERDGARGRVGSTPD